MSFTHVLLVGIGGFAGSVARYLTGVALRGVVTSFPLSTFVVNIVGSFVLGVVIGSTTVQGDNEKMKLLLVTGFCGGFTTFSAFAFENVNMIDQHAITTSVIYTISSVLIGILAVMVGIWIARQF